MAKKLFSQKELSTLSAEEIIEKIKHENYSLLDSFGAQKLRQEMVPVGKICNTVVNYLFRGSKKLSTKEQQDKQARRNLLKTFSKITPGSHKKLPPLNGTGVVIGFNHPSLGEIPRLIAMKVAAMEDSLICFPVNLPWYEALAPNYDRIRRLGIVITPTITPSTWGKIGLKEGSVMYEGGQRLKKDFKDIYTKMSSEIVKEGGVIFVAPSATRQATVFKTEEAYNSKEDIIPTMSILAIKLLSDPKINCDFLPLSILPPQGYSRGLNIGKKYQLIPGNPMSAKEIRQKYFTTPNPKRLEGFDYDFHKRLAENLPRDFWY